MALTEVLLVAAFILAIVGAVFDSARATAVGLALFLVTVVL